MTINKAVFLGAMPRAGSTLLMNLLGQNPNFHVTATSGLIELLQTSRQRYTQGAEFNSQDKTEMDARFTSYCRGAFWGWCNGVETDATTFIDKSRGWISNTEFTQKLVGGNMKIIAPIRDVRGVTSSMEKIHQTTSLRLSAAVDVGKMRGMTVTDRAQDWLNGLPIGVSLKRVQDVVQRGLVDSICWVRLEDLVTNPEAEIAKIYKYLEEPIFEHDIRNIQQITHEDDRHHGFDGLHSIKSEITNDLAEDWDQVLGKEVSDQLLREFEWFYKEFYPEVLAPVQSTAQPRSPQALSNTVQQGITSINANGDLVAK